MRFSAVLSTSSGCLSAWSPCEKYVAIPDSEKLYIRESKINGSLYVSYQCNGKIQMLQWSPDSTMIVSGNTSKSSLATNTLNYANIEVFNIFNPHWKCCINCGSGGLSSASWAPDSLHLITLDQFSTSLSVWSLSKVHEKTVRNPSNFCPCYEFSEDGSYMAVAHRVDCKDYITVMETDTWCVVQEFGVNTCNMAGLAWGKGTASGSVISVWDTVLQSTLCLYSMCGRLLQQIKCEDLTALRHVLWTPTGKHLLLLTTDGKMEVLRYITWQTESRAHHRELLEMSGGGQDDQLKVYREAENSNAYEVEARRPLSLGSCSRVDPSSIVCVLSSGGRYLATKLPQHPATVWVWCVPRLTLLAVLHHKATVRDVRWSPTKPYLLVCTGAPAVFVWTPCGAICTPIPDVLTFNPISVRWSPDGLKLLLCNKSGNVCICELSSTS